MSRKNIILIASVCVVLAASLIGGGNLVMFFNPLGLILVVGGTLLAAALAFPKATLYGAWQQIKAVNSAKVRTSDELVDLFYKLGRIRRFRGVRHMEDVAKKINHQFLRMAVIMVADERRPGDIAQRLEQEMDFFLARRESQRAVLSFMGRLAPAFGLAGTMIGLIRMLHTISDPDAVAAGMSVALLTTFYGLMLANLVVLPIERKIHEHNRAEAVEMALIVEGAVALASEDNASAVASRLSSFKYAEDHIPESTARFDLRSSWRSVRSMVGGLRRASNER